MNEPNQENPSLSEGARRLSLIGRPDLIGAQVTLTDGRVVSAEDMSCGDNADLVFEGIDATKDPQTKLKGIEAARAIFDAHFGSIIEKPE
jgi:hypothetical protein